MDMRWLKGERICDARDTIPPSTMCIIKWFIRHHICLVLQPTDTDGNNQGMLLFMVHNEHISEAHLVLGKLEGWNSPKLRHLNNTTLQKKQNETKKTKKKKPSPLFPVLSKFRESFNSLNPSHIGSILKKSSGTSFYIKKRLKL